MNTLEEIQNHYNFTTDKNTRHSYLKHYDKIFLPYKNRKIKILEIGTLVGGSIMLWNKYFTNCTIFGLDIDISNIQYDDVFNSSNIYMIPKNFDTVDDNFFGDICFDIIIDDGSHTVQHQVKTIDIFTKKLNPGGILIVEDISSYYSNYQYIQSYIKDLKGFEWMDLRSENGIEDNILLLYRNQ